MVGGVAPAAVLDCLATWLTSEALAATLRAAILSREKSWPRPDFSSLKSIDEVYNKISVFLREAILEVQTGETSGSRRLLWGTYLISTDQKASSCPAQMEATPDGCPGSYLGGKCSNAFVSFSLKSIDDCRWNSSLMSNSVKRFHFIFSALSARISMDQGISI